MKDFEVSINEYLPLRDVVFYALRTAILKGELEPGERLMEVALANKMGVSRTPIREAIRKLELEGLVIMIPRRGAEVASITEKDLVDVLEVRMFLEKLAAELACERRSEEDIEKLEKACKAFEESFKVNDITVHAERDVDFHDAIFQATGNTRLIQILNNLREQMYRYRLEYLKNKGAHSRIVKEHKEILEAIKEGDSAKAGKLVYEHVLVQRDDILGVIRKKENDKS